MLILQLESQRQHESRAGPHLVNNVCGGTTLDLSNYAISIVISLAIGLAGFLLAYKIFDWLTPGVQFADQLREGNNSVAIFLAGLFIGLGLLLGSAVK